MSPVEHGTLIQAEVLAKVGIYLDNPEPLLNLSKAPWRVNMFLRDNDRHHPLLWILERSHLPPWRDYIALLVAHDFIRLAKSGFLAKQGLAGHTYSGLIRVGNRQRIWSIINMRLTRRLLPTSKGCGKPSRTEEGHASEGACGKFQVHQKSRNKKIPTL